MIILDGLLRIPLFVVKGMINPKFTADELNKRAKGTLVETLGIEFTRIEENYLEGKMPVDHRTVQPAKILHGGAVAALAETLGSMASFCCLNPNTHQCVGIEINANHIRSVASGFVYGKAESLHIGKRTHVWDIKVRDDFDRLVSVCRLTVAVLEK